MPVTYDGRQKIDGQNYIKLICETYDGWTKKNIVEHLVAPEHQHPHLMHPGHITAFVNDPAGNRACISPSVKGFADVRKRFRWGK